MRLGNRKSHTRCKTVCIVKPVSHMPMRKVGPIQLQSAIPQKQELNEEVASKKINAHDVPSCSIFAQYIYA